MLASPPLRLTLRVLLTILLVWALNRYLPQCIAVFGGIPASIIIGSLLTLGNLFLRPLLDIVTFPFHLLFTLATTIVVNAAFLWAIYRIVLLMDPGVVSLAITGGFTGWIVISCVIGAANWVMKHVV